jgi:hypothetical protein
VEVEVLVPDLDHLREQVPDLLPRLAGLSDRQVGMRQVRLVVGTGSWEESRRAEERAGHLEDWEARHSEGREGMACRDHQAVV